MVFRSKLDVWLVVVMVATAVIALSGAVAGLPYKTLIEWLPAIVLLLGAAVLPLALVVNTKYTVDSESLRIDCGPFRWQIPLSDIHGVQPSHNPLASPALSLDRLEIRYGDNRVVLVSPRDKDGFIAALRLPAA
ncbi:MAG: PH domain-containing protein [Pseudomonadota bacterium]